MKLSEINKKIEDFVLFNPVINFLGNMVWIFMMLVMFSVPIVVGFLIYIFFKYGACSIN